MGEYIKIEDAAKAFSIHTPYCYEDCLNDLTSSILDGTIEAADVAPVVHARWVECDYVEPCVHGFGTIRYKNKGSKCTNCVHAFKTELLWKDNYCPNYGAKCDLEG